MVLKKYEEKKERYKWLFDEHYSNNRHHPEYFQIHNNKDFEMDLLDLLEMLCDWCGYRDYITYTDASDLVEQQCKRYNFSTEIKDLLLNTLKNNFVSFGGVNYKKEEDISAIYTPHGIKKKKTKNILVDLKV